MKLKFKNQSFQTDAVNAVADLFAGQEKQSSVFSVVQEAQTSLLQTEHGVGNALLIEDEALLANMHEVQKRHLLPQTPELGRDGSGAPQFCIEMETGTGKTYVYTKTMFELHQRYGFTKFIVVVPSVAIREGVYKSLQTTQEHFALQYDSVPCRFFIYNSAKLSDVRQFATSANIEIMIINIDAFKKAENVINQAQDRLNGETAMRYIQDTHPIVIIDEPQSVDNTPKAKEAIASLNPLCVLRYSATHREKINLLYRLTPVDAYQMGLVKQICVSSNQVEGNFNKPYIRLEAVSNEKGFRAKVEMDVQGKDGKVARKTLTVKTDADLYLLSGERELYEGYVVSGIDCTPGQECVEFANTETVMLGKAIGDVDELVIKKAQIRRTIEAHLEKELRYTEKGIKVLSLFFIDKVEKYRTAEGKPGIYAQMFEDCYRELLNKPKFAALRERFPAEASRVHDGYFSQDKKGNYKNTKGDTQDDQSTYTTIMKDKEWLLSFDCPLRFIFSHSALKEGWDNPNVFQVCTLIEQKSVFTCRQKVGRGLRLCVDQEGNRIDDRNVNVLHVMANESFAEFADALQKEIEQETGVRFGVLDISLFAGMVYTETRQEIRQVTPELAEAAVKTLEQKGYLDAHKKITPALREAIQQNRVEMAEELMPVLPKITEFSQKEESASLEPTALEGAAYTVTVTEEKTATYEDAAALMAHLEQKGYISKTGKIKDTMKEALQKGTVDLPAHLASAKERIEDIICKADQRPPIRDASKEVRVRLNKEVMLSPEFAELWNKIKQKTTYRVQVDTTELVERCVHDLQNMPAISKARLISRTAELHIERQGISHVEREMRTSALQEEAPALPDILKIVGEKCLIKRSTVRDILIGCERLAEFTGNPQAFIEQCVEIINRHRFELAVDGIRYLRLEGEEYFIQEIFDSAELIANLEKNAVPVEHSVYDHVIYDSSTVERPFALALDNDPDVKMFFKIPDKFQIETPIGTYNPDWAVYFEKNGEQKLYFVLETKGSTDANNRRNKENMKIHCGERHFAALDDVDLHVARDWNAFKRTV